MPEECLFCQIVARKLPADIKYETDEIVVFRDINPVADTHLLIVPKKHIVSIADIKTEDRNLLGEIMLVGQKLAKELNLDGGFRLVTNSGPDSGQLAQHLHFHFLGGNKLGPIA